VKEKQKNRLIILGAFLIGVVDWGMRFVFEYSLNEGISWGINFVNISWLWVLIWLGLVIFAILEQEEWLWVMVIGAGFNTVDRVVFGGVRDYIQILVPLRFNLADVMISLAMVMILIRYFSAKDFKRN
jgi:lipoprotein signal peptidase